MVTWLWILGGLLVAAVALLAGNRRLRRRASRAVRRAATRRRPTRPGRAAGRSSRPRPGTVRCSAACRTSRKPARDRHGRLTCDCPCRGRHHGRYRAGTAASIRATPVSREQKAAQRRAVAERDRARWEAREKALQDRVVVTRGGRPRSELTERSRKAMAAHAGASPSCRAGSVSARTVRGRDTVTQEITCGTCGARL